MYDRPPRLGWRRSALAVLATVAGLAVLALELAALYVASGTRQAPAFVRARVRPTRLSAEAPGIITTQKARIGARYHLGIFLSVSGPGRVEILSARARYADPGLQQPGATIGWGCDGAEMFGAVVADDATRLPTADIRPLSGARLRAEDRDCWYLLLSFRPDRHGRLHARRGEVVYRVDGRTHRARFDFRTMFSVVGTGPDPREKPPGPVRTAPPTPGGPAGRALS